MTIPLKIQNLIVRSGERQLLAIDRLNLSAGSLTGIRGPSGAGKTTALHAFAGLLAAEGHLFWGETDLCQLSQSARTQFRATNMGMIFQDFLLFEELTARDNALIANVFHRDRTTLAQRADALMERLGITALSGTRADRLSGGERQRVAVVRALAHNPAILLADEPTASLDRATADHLIADLAALARDDGRTVIVVSHDEHVWSAMDQMLTIRDGSMVDENG